jgi:hypothetical protein
MDNVWEQEKLEARKMLGKRAESPASNAPTHDGGPSFFLEEIELFLRTPCWVAS